MIGAILTAVRLVFMAKTVVEEIERLKKSKKPGRVVLSLLEKAVERKVKKRAS